MAFGDKKRLKESITAAVAVFHGYLEQRAGITFPVEGFLLDAAIQNALLVFKAGYSMEEAGEIGQGTYFRLLVEKYPTLGGGPIDQKGNELLEKHLAVMQKVFG